MFSEAKVTEIYCMADDFCKEFSKVQEKYIFEDKNRKHRNKPKRMSDAEIMVILILFHSGGFRCFKHYYKEYVCKHLRHLFPKCVSYNRKHSVNYKSPTFIYNNSDCHYKPNSCSRYYFVEPICCSQHCPLDFSSCFVNALSGCCSFHLYGSSSNSSS